MAVFTHTAEVPYSLDTVFSWHMRPGALTRLSPEWAQAVVEESHPPLAPGTRARMKTSVPGTRGVVRVPFVCEHAAGPEPFSFIDRMTTGPLHSWTHTHRFTEAADPAACRIDDRIDYHLAPSSGRLSEGFDTLAMDTVLTNTFEARTRRLLGDLDFQADLTRRTGGAPQRILIAGASGLLGRQVAALLSTAGHEVRRLVRTTPWREDEVRWNPGLGLLDARALAWADVVICLSGASIGTRFTEPARERILSSRLDSTRLLVLTMEQLDPADRPDTFVCASAVGYYGAERGDERLPESADSGDGFLAEVCRRWETEAARAEELGVRRVSIRTGVVLTTLGGPLRLQLPLYLTGLGGRLGAGDQWLSWVSLDDIAQIYARAALDDSLSGPVNAVAPEPVRQREFAQTLGDLLSMPSALPVPPLAPTLLLGPQAARELALADQRVVPEALTGADYTFRHPTLRAALASTLGCPPED
ncbi:TIGR01777 family oxidoreductase [Nocardia zapadnayensis]|nr:TIGR01777 family oxidoreductase [Nocardia zapadnayensis]MCX0278242.1 TIGR01777 family oxidoreductase [Nocardia zapadnayensis]